jgi:hypothetical protein
VPLAFRILVGSVRDHLKRSPINIIRIITVHRSAAASMAWKYVSVFSHRQWKA